MTALAAVRVHVRHNVEHRFLAQHAGDGVLVIQKPAEKAFHPPFGHGLAGVLAGGHPDGALGRVRLTDRQEINRLAVQGFADHLQRDLGMSLGPGDQVLVPLHGVGCEIGKPDGIRLRGVLQRQHAVGIIRVDTKPGLAVIGGAGAIAWPAFQIGRTSGVLDRHAQGRAQCAGDAKMEPLEEFRPIVLADFQANASGIGGVQNVDIAAVERVSDVKGHWGRLRRLAKG